MRLESRGRRPGRSRRLGGLLAAAALAAFIMVSRVLADQTVPTSETPVITLHSPSGLITIESDEGIDVRLSGSDNVGVSRFAVSRLNDQRVMLPPTKIRRLTADGWYSANLPARQCFIPGLRDGADGVRIENPGGDITLRLPRRVGALFVNAGAGSVVLNRLRGPYIIMSSGGDVRLHNAFGFGFVRTVDGTVDLRGVGGNVRVDTADGRIVSGFSIAGRADVQTQRGEIEWNFGRLGRGPYRFRSDSGNIRIGVPAGMGVNVDAQSQNGAVNNGLDAGSGTVRFASARAVSLSVGSGGPEIAAQSRSGTITIVPLEPRK